MHETEIMLLQQVEVGLGVAVIVVQLVKRLHFLYDTGSEQRSRRAAKDFESLQQTQAANVRPLHESAGIRQSVPTHAVAAENVRGYHSDRRVRLRHFYQLIQAIRENPVIRIDVLGVLGPLRNQAKALVVVVYDVEEIGIVVNANPR